MFRGTIFNNQWNYESVTVQAIGMAPEGLQMLDINLGWILEKPENGQVRGPAVRATGDTWGQG